MEIEYEATYENIDKDEIRKRLIESGATLLKKEFVQKRSVYNLPKGHEVEGGWLRVRDEGDKITMSLKVVINGKIEDQKEVCIVVDCFSAAEDLLKMIGCEKKSYQETLREKWSIDDVEICIDEWPFLEPFVEIEGINEEKVKSVSDRLGFNYNSAFFGSVDGLYSKKYGISIELINNKTPLLTFEMDNPFLSHADSDRNE